MWAAGLNCNRRTMRRRRSFRLLVLITAASLLLLQLPAVYQWGDWIRQTNPFSEQRSIERNFDPTAAELACLYGTSYPGESTTVGATDPIPNIVHFIYGLNNPYDHPNAGQFDFLCYLAVRSAIVALRPDAVYLHYTYLAHPPSPDGNANPLTNPWIQRLYKDITLVYHPPAPKTSRAQYAHLSDFLRLRFLYEQGGIYLDIDSFALRPFTALLHSPRPRDIVLGYEGGNRWGLCNAIMVARKGSRFVERWLESYKNTDLSHEWNYHSVILPRKLAKDFPGEVCALPPDAFFWPTWTWRHIDWMHAPLSKKEAKYWEAEIRRHGGSLFEHQVAYHAWNQMAYDRYLKYLTPKAIKSKDTRFNLVMRRFLEEDL